MGKGGKKLIFSTSQAKLYEVEVMRLKARDVAKTEDRTLEATQEISSKDVSQDIRERKEDSGRDVVGRMAKLGRAIVPGGGGEGKEEKVREAKAEVAAEEISNNETDSTLENKREKKIIEQRRDMRIKREEGGLDASDGVGERLDERVGGGGVREGKGEGEKGGVGGVSSVYGGGGVGGGGGGVTEWSLVMSEVRLQNTELRMSLARVRQR